MLWPKLENKDNAMHLAFINTIGENALDNEEVSYNLLKYLVENHKEKVEKKYDIKIESAEEIIEIRDKITIKNGAILFGGRINEQKISSMILSDFREGKFGRITVEKI